MRHSAAMLFAGVLAGFLPLRAASQAAEAATAASLVPLEIPGYELRTLDVHKSVLFQVGGSQVEVSVPVFLYYPAPGASPVARLLREAQAALLKLAAKPEWTADELREVIAGLDQAARLLEPPAKLNGPASAARG